MSEPKTDGSHNCGNCRFSAKQMLPPPNIGQVLVCFHSPPVPMLMPSPQGPALTAQFPMMQENGFCFQHEPKPEEAPKLALG